MFVANGYHAAAMDDIAERAGVSKPVLYQHFPGKLELYLALLDTQAEALGDAVVDALAGDRATTSERVHARAVGATSHFVDRDATHDGAFRLIFESDLGQRARGARAGRGGDRSKTMRAVADTVAADTGLGPRRGRTAGHRADRRGAGRRALVAGQRPAGRAGRRGPRCSSRCCGGASRTSRGRAELVRGRAVRCRRRGGVRCRRSGCGGAPAAAGARLAWTAPRRIAIDEQEDRVEVKIGVLHTAARDRRRQRADPDEVEEAGRRRRSRASTGSSSLTDERGRKVIVPANLVAYVEIAQADVRRVGFATG